MKIEASVRSLQERTSWLKTPLTQPTEEHLVAYGAVSFLVPRDKVFSKMRSSTLRQWFMPPIAFGQFSIVELREAPRAMVTWACLSDEASARFANTLRPPPLLDWMSGENIWIMSLMAPYGKSAKRFILKNLWENLGSDKFSTWRVSSGDYELVRYTRSEKGAAFQIDRRDPWIFKNDKV